MRCRSRAHSSNGPRTDCDKENVAAALPKVEELIRQVIDKKLVPGLWIAIGLDEINLLSK